MIEFSPLRNYCSCWISFSQHSIFKIRVTTKIVNSNGRDKDTMKNTHTAKRKQEKEKRQKRAIPGLLQLPDKQINLNILCNTEEI